MRNFGQVPEKIAPYKNYGPPKHFRFIRKGDFEAIPFYRAPHYGLTQKGLTQSELIEQARQEYLKVGQPEPRTGLYVAGIALAAFVAGPLLFWPFIIKSFKPELSYGRRVGIGLGISIGLAAVRTVAKSVAGKD